MSLKTIFAAFILMIVQNAMANVRLPAVINNNMVLQQRSSAKIWGWADPGEKVFITTSWNNMTDSITTNGNGQWQLHVSTPTAGGPYSITIKGNNTIELENVLIGEVWICSGQSNMEMNYHWGLPQMEEDFATANNRNIRLFHIPKSTAATPQDHGEGSWTAADSNTVKSFSAVAYYFGKKLNDALGVPVGLIHASWGGTPAETWTPAADVLSNATLSDAATRISHSDGWPTLPGLAYNGMIAPVVGFNLAGAIWYQGETNTGTASTYRQLFSTMIKSWRQKWSKEFPFYFVQLAPFHYGNKNIAALLREAQTQTLAVPKTGMIVTTDLADNIFDIHPKDKRTVGYRLANLALAETYDAKNIFAKSPVYKNILHQNNAVVLSFDDVGSGLTSKGEPIGFFVAGADHVFYPAEAKTIGSDKIELRSSKVSKPVAVRYAFSNVAEGNIFTLEGLPLSPFRTDDWPVDTSAEK
ncbi:MAG: sialate O-acetylesterase [Flavisolibacter sp.]